MRFILSAIIISVFSLHACVFWGSTAEPFISHTTMTVSGYYSVLKYHDGYCYYTYGANGLRIIDVADPLNCFEISPFDMPELDEKAVAFDAEGDIGCLLSDKRLTILDMSQTPQIVKVSSIPTIKGLAGVTKYNKVSLSGNYIYTKSYNEGENRWDFVILDISDPAIPVETSRIEDLVIRDFILYGNYMYYCVPTTESFYDPPYQLKIMDVSDKTSPVEVVVGYFDGGRSLMIVRDKLYVMGDETVYILDITTPVSPVVKSNFSLEIYDDSIQVYNSPYLFAIGSHDSIYSVDLDIEPVVTSRFITPDSPITFSVNGEYLYLITTSGFYTLLISGLIK